MSSFADPTQTRTVRIGDCQCPGTPHAQDEAVVRTELGYGAIGALQVAGYMTSNGMTFDPMASNRKLIELQTESWNLLGPTGAAVRPSEASIALLKQSVAEALAEAITEAISPSEPLPNGSGAPSVDGSPESASPTPETEPTTTSTTS